MIFILNKHMCFIFDTFIHHLIDNIRILRTYKYRRQNSVTSVTPLPGMIALKLGGKTMGFIVLIIFRFGFSDVTLIFGGAITHCLM